MAHVFIICHNKNGKFVVMKGLHLKHHLLILQLQFDLSTHLIHIPCKIPTFLDKLR